MFKNKNSRMCSNKNKGYIYPLQWGPIRGTSGVETDRMGNSVRP